MSAGRPRIPRQVKVIRGTFRKDRNPSAEIPADVVRKTPRPPAHLNRYAKAMWKKIAPTLVSTRVLTEHDLVTFELLCVQYGDYRELYDAVHCEVPGQNGRKRRQTLAEYMVGRNSQTQPEYTAMQKAYQNWKSYMAEFGLSPLARNRIEHKPIEKEVDPMEELLDAKL